MACTWISSCSRFFVAKGSSASMMVVEKQPGLATLLADSICSRFCSQRPNTNSRSPKRGSFRKSLPRSMILHAAGISFSLRNALDNPCPRQRKITSGLSNVSVNTRSVSPIRSRCISATGVPAEVVLMTDSICTSGWRSRMRSSSPAVYPVPPTMLTLIIVVNGIINFQRVGHHFREAHYILTTERFVAFAIFAKAGAHKVVLAGASQHGKMVGTQLYFHFSRDELLGVV